MPAPLDGSCAASNKDGGKRAVRMPIAVADTTAEQQDRVIEQRAVAVRSGSEFFEVSRKQRHMIGLDLCALIHLFRLVLMMRQRMMRFRNANLWIRSSILLSA